jgi:hypothetical protein
MIRSKRLYDVCFRAFQGLPLPARALTTVLLESIIGRLLATEQVVVCAYVWMANHPHMQLFSLDATGLTRFHGQLKKRLTDFVKRLLGLSHLRLWHDRSTLGEVLDLEAAIERFAYSFLNPVRAKLARSIDDYEGCNTWKEFLSAPADVHAVIEKEVPWILATDIEALSESNPSWSEELRAIEALREKASIRPKNILKIYPFRWLEAFGISDPVEIERVRGRIIARVREEEQKLQLERAPSQRIEGFVVTDEYKPPRKERRVFMYASSAAKRIEHLEQFSWFDKRCRHCFQLMKQGLKDISWPPGCFIPPAPQLCNAL